MARRADDLLSIFDPNRAPSDGSGGATRTKKPSGSRSKSSGKTGRGTGRSSSQGMFLSRRQVILAGSAAALLLILTFTLGIVIGKPGSADNNNPALARQTRVMVRAQFTRQHPHTQKPMTRHAVFMTLTQEFGVSPRAIIDIRQEGERLVMELGPFPSDKVAQGYIEKWRLPAVHLNLDAPFRFHEIVAYQKRR